jgi:NDP-sugar pyrophosphorylase family protein
MIAGFISRFADLFKMHAGRMPWEITNDLSEIIIQMIAEAGEDYHADSGVLVHTTAVIEQNVILKPPVIIGKNCFIGANAYIRGPVFLDESVKIGAGCEIKQSVIFSGTAIAHFNYIGNSIIGRDVNFEAGSVAANHYNEREDKNISVVFHSKIINTHSGKFGSLVGDRSKIGANAVLSPGTLLHPGSIVKRLELVNQLVE